jgi:hypothetical protein
MGVPGALSRVFRDRGRLWAVLLLALVTVAASGVQSAAAAVLRQTVDANWRGSYQILVTGQDAATSLDGLLLPNSLGDAQHGLTLAELAKIRSLDGVGVAAPVGEVIVPRFKLASPTLTLPAGSVNATAAPQAFRLTATFTTNDGLGERVVSQSSQNIVVDESETGSSSAPGSATPGLARPANGIWGIKDGSISLPSDTLSSTLNYTLSGGTPSSTAHITLVDPIAEKKLLGKAGAFLDPLIAVKRTVSTTTASQLLEWATSTDSAYAKSFVKTEASLSDADTQLAAPVLVSSQSSADLTLKLSIDSFGSATINPGSDGFNSPYILPEQLLRGGAGKDVGTSTSDVSAILNPFATTNSTIAWPGTAQPTPSSTQNSLLLLQAVGVSNTGKASRVADGEYQLRAEGFKNPVPDVANLPANAFALSKNGRIPGTESAYPRFTDWDRGPAAR